MDRAWVRAFQNHCLALAIPARALRIFPAKYLMHTYQASVRAQVKGRSQVIKTEVRALNAQEVRWLLWAQWGFHSIQSGPSQIKNQK